LKRMPMLDSKSVIAGFNRPDIQVVNLREQLERKLENINRHNTNFLFMSSGNYEGMDILKVIGSR
ncbi:MAG: peptidoglycan synthetase, partial [Ginsengibacter sp.]